MGTPAKVVRSAPDFPKRPDDAQRRQTVATIVAEFERFVADDGVTVAERDGLRSYTRGTGRRWRLWWRRSADQGAPALERGDTVLSEVPLSEDERSAYRKTRVYWLDLAGRHRSGDGSPLTEELVLFLGRYGIRLPRD
jgi:hypothetical protein